MQTNNLITTNPHFIAAVALYQEAMRLRRAGLLGNVAKQREHLRCIYRLLAGKTI